MSKSSVFLGRAVGHYTITIIINIMYFSISGERRSEIHEEWLLLLLLIEVQMEIASESIIRIGMYRGVLHSIYLFVCVFLCVYSRRISSHSLRVRGRCLSMRARVGEIIEFFMGSAVSAGRAFVWRTMDAGGIYGA